MKALEYLKRLHRAYDLSASPTKGLVNITNISELGDCIEELEDYINRAEGMTSEEDLVGNFYEDAPKV